VKTDSALVDTALLASRLIIGGSLAAHGAQKHLGWFNGPGPDGTAKMVETLGFRPPGQFAQALSLTELTAGALIAFGALGPIAPAMLLSDMLVASETGTATTFALGNAQDGVAVFSPSNTIGPGNIISGNLRGVDISGSAATGVVIHDNLIGTDITGTLARGNGNGVNVGSAPNTRIGGSAPGAGNVISGNQTGIFLNGSSHQVINGIYNSAIQGNIIGLTAAGNAALPNGVDGLFENVGGQPFSLTTRRLNAFARIAVCGLIASYEGKEKSTLEDLRILLEKVYEEEKEKDSSSTGPGGRSR